MAEHPHARSTQVGSFVATHAIEHPGVHHFEAPTTHPNGAAAFEFAFTLAAGIDEGEVLHGKPWMVLILAV